MKKKNIFLYAIDLSNVSVNNFKSLVSYDNE